MAIKEADVRTLLDSSPICNKIVDTDGKLQYMSAAGVEGLKIQDIESYYGKDYPVDFFPVEVRATLREYLYRAMSGERCSVNTPANDTEGNLVWFETTFVPVTDTQGQLKFIIVASVDITETMFHRNNLEQLVRESERKSRAWLEHSPVSTMIVDLDLNLQYMSSSGVKALPIDDITRFYGKPYPFEFYPETLRERILKDLEFVRRTGEVVIQEAPLVKMDGSETWLHSTFVPVHDDEGVIEYIIVVSMDITERKQAEKDIRSAKAAAEAASEAKSAFFTNMSHEIRTPINGVTGMAEVLLNTEGLSDEQVHLVRLIKQSGEALLSIVNGILDLSSIEAGKFEVNNAVFDLQVLIQNVSQLLSPRAKEAGLAMSIEYPDVLPKAFVGDAGKIRQVLINLLENAIKFTPSGYVRVSVTVEESSEESCISQVRIAVEDSGLGVPETQRTEIFKPFAQVDASSTREHEGTGLGLAIARDLVRLMGGEVGLEDHPTQGSVFHFRLPLSRATAVASPTPVDDRVDALPENLSILLVEDNYVNQLVAQRLLENMGCRVDVACDGLEAVGCHEENTYDLIFMDCQMPKMNGYEATQKIRDAEMKRGGKRHTPVIALTAHAMKGEKERCLASGMDDYLSKPISARMLREILEQYFAPREKVYANIS